MTHQRVERLRRRVGRIAYGGDYNPEQWPEELQAEDNRLMHEANVSMVSLGIFSWAEVEPQPGAYDFTRFDRTMDRLAEGGIAVCLATMTASPPPWLSARHPEILPVRADGTRLWPGARQHFCPSSPVYREHATRLTERLARRYASHPALALWHVGNEYGCHTPSCYCDVSAEAFRRWLRQKYGDIAALNRAWSTSFWAQRYASFEEVLPPRTAPTFPNSAQRLDYARFGSDELLACFSAEKAVLDRETPETPVTTNFPPLAKDLDLFTWARHVDVVGYDSYPDPRTERAPAEAAFGYDVMRGLRDGQPWLLMEQAAGAVNWLPVNSPKPPGLMRLWSWQAIAHGADAVLFFQWRQSRGGAEKYFSAMVPHAGSGTRTFREVRDLGRELRANAGLHGAPPPRADVAIVLDWPSWWALELDAHPSSGLRYMDAVMAHYLPLYEAGIACDVVRPDADLSGRRLVVVPNLHVVDDDAAGNLGKYVADGGTLLMSFFSGIVDPDDRVHLGGYPAPFRTMLGLWIEEFWPLSPDETVELSSGTGGLWSELIHLEGADAVASFASGELAGRPAVTRHAYGAGTAWYLGTRPDPATMRQLFAQVTAQADVAPVLPGLPAGVTARVRGAYHVLLNHTTEPVTVSLPRPMRDELTGTDPAPAVRLAARGVAVLS